MSFAPIAFAILSSSDSVKDFSFSGWGSASFACGERSGLGVLSKDGGYDSGTVGCAV